MNRSLGFRLERIGMVLSKPRVKVFFRTALVVGLALFSSVGAERAEAYPQWQFISGTSRCNQCHFNPAGGGLIRGYGRDAVADDLATFEDGDGDFMFGAIELPDRVALGGDFRVAGLLNNSDSPNGTEIAVFPMQADVQARVGVTSSISVMASVGARGQVRSDDNVLGADGYEGEGGVILSREHFVMWQPASKGRYLRVGRFYAPYGLRMAEHITFVRRNMGFNLLEETYNVSGGYVESDWEAHITGFTPLLGQGYATGVAAMFERRFDDEISLGLQSRFAFQDDKQTYALGATGKWYLEDLSSLLMGEANLVRQDFGDANTSDDRLVGLLGLVVMPESLRGFTFNLFLEHNQTSLAAPDSAINAAMAQINWIPYPHIEVVLTSRFTVSPSNTDNSHNMTLLQAHYYL